MTENRGRSGATWLFYPPAHVMTNGFFTPPAVPGEATGALLYAAAVFTRAVAELETLPVPVRRFGYRHIAAKFATRG